MWWHGRTESEPALPQFTEELPPRHGNTRGAEENEPMIRKELVNRVRREIADGVYDTPKKWEEALDRLLDRMYRD